MKRLSIPFLAGAACGCAVLLLHLAAGFHAPLAVHAIDGATSSVSVDYPRSGSIFPPEITPPTFIWHDASETAERWHIEVSFGDGAAPLHFESQGERPAVGEIDPACVSSTNEKPKLTAEMANAHTWTPDTGSWELIKKHSVAKPATIAFGGFRTSEPRKALSSGFTLLQTSKDPVGAPIFYRDVPLMPSEGEKGIIKPLDANAVPLIKWRLRSIDRTQSRVVLSGIHSCANCHSFSNDGKTMGMDMDGPRNDRGLYALVPVKPQMTIRSEDMVNWNPTQEQQFASNRVAFMSQVSPDGKYVLSMVTRPDRAAENNYYVANFKDYRFLQVFYPTRGVLAWYDRATGQRHPLPGADDPHYVQTDGVWSPDGKYIVFARAESRDPYPADGKMATHANDASEMQIQYDLYRVPFNNGRGGKAEPLVGASANGMSNSFPKISPDGKWIVYVQARNGQLMRPDSKLYIVPAGGGTARRLNANMEPMNSWHSWSPNGHWLVFSSKSRGPYTRMFLTHIDAQGNDSPAILIDNVAAANRAVNIPEFVNIAADGMQHIAAPAVDMYKQFDHAGELGEKGQDAAAVVEWTALATSHPDDARIHANLAGELVRTGDYRGAVLHYARALHLNPELYAAHGLLAAALLKVGDVDDALKEYERSLRIQPSSADLHNSYGGALARKGRLDEATDQFNKAIELNPGLAEAYNNLGIAMARQGRIDEAAQRFAKAVGLNPRFAEAHNNLGIAMLSNPQQIQPEEAEKEFKAALELNPRYADAQNNLGTLYRQQGKTAEAEQLFRQAIESDAHYVKAYLSLGDLLVSESRNSEADAVLQKALAIAPENREILNMREQIRGAAGR
jgi:Tfp pilus assembly protein PilF/Tol biopolymer transport system component